MRFYASEERCGAGAGLSGVMLGEDVEGEVVVAAGEEGLRGFDEELVVGSGVGEEGHGGVELEVVGGAEDLADGEGPGEEDELRAFAEARAEDGMGEVGGGFVERGDGVGAGGGAGAEAVELREDEPDPVGGLAVVAEFGEDFFVDGGLGGEEALEVVGVGHGHGLLVCRCGGWALGGAEHRRLLASRTDCNQV